MVTHESDIAAFADRVVTMRDGQIISDVRADKPVAAVRTAAETRAAGTALLRRPAPGAGTPARSTAFGAFATMVTASALQALARNKMRSALTMLGVFIGVAALIAMVAVGQGANQAVRKQIESLGTDLVVVVPGAARMGGVRGGFGSASTLTVSDAEAIRREATAVSSVSYTIRQSGQTQYANRNWNTGIQGVSPNYPPVTNWQIAAGRGISEEDDDTAALVVVLGQTVYRQLFGSNENPIDATIQVKNVPLRVIGVLASKGQTPFGMDQDDLVMVPFTTAERKVLGVAAPSQQQAPMNWVYPPAPNPYNLQRRLTGFVNQIYVQAVGPSQVEPAIGQVTGILARRHRIKPGDINDFSVRNLSQIAETAESSSRILALLLAAVASISLVVGGIGIMNILLVSVTERTREIGLRMAIGARRLHVLLQFLAEAIILSVTGGIAGIIMGAGFSQALSLMAGWPTQISLGRHRRRVRVLGSGWNLLRLLSGAQSRPPRSDRGVTLRVTEGAAPFSWAQPMLAKQPYGARLRAFFTHLLCKADPRTHRQVLKAVEHAVAMEIDLAAIARLQEAELAQLIEPHNGSGWLALVGLHLSLQLADLVLQLSARSLEGVVDRECQVGVPLVHLRGPSDIDLAPVGKLEPDMDLIETAGLMVAAGPFQDHPTGRHATEAALKLFHVLDDTVAKRRARAHALEVDFNRGFHRLFIRLSGENYLINLNSGYPLMQISGRRRATLRASPACSAAATTAPTSL